MRKYRYSNFVGCSHSYSAEARRRKASSSWISVVVFAVASILHDFDTVSNFEREPRTALFAHSGKKSTMVDIARDGDRP